MREIPVFLYAFLIGLVIRFSVLQIGVVLLSVVPSGLWLTHPWLDFVLRAPFLAIIEASTYAAIGFIFWSGTDESWLAAAALTAGGATLCGFWLWGLPSVHQPYLLAVVVSSRLAGSGLGPWYGNRTEHDPVVSEVRNVVFMLYPFRLPS